VGFFHFSFGWNLPLFVDTSHGFRRGRGARTFFLAVADWPDMKCLVQCDVVKCFDRIEHTLLIFLLNNYLARKLPLCGPGESLSQSRHY